MSLLDVTFLWLKASHHSLVVESVKSLFVAESVMSLRDVTLLWLKVPHHSFVVESVMSLFGGRKRHITLSWLKA